MSHVLNFMREQNVIVSLANDKMTNNKMFYLDVKSQNEDRV